MPPPMETVEDIEAQALKLPPGERVELIERLIASVEPPSLSPAWQAEVERRIADLDAGRTQTIPAEEVFARIDEKLRRAGA
jgi:putative addiction module component (TIGR02574 family)